MQIARVYAATGLVPDARLIVRMLLAPISGRDYTQAALRADAGLSAARRATMERLAARCIAP